MRKVIWLLVIFLLTAMLTGCGVAVYQGEDAAGAPDPELARIEQDLILLQQRNQDLLLEKQDLTTEKEQLIGSLVRAVQELKQAGLPIYLEGLKLEIKDKLAIEEREVTQTGGSATKAEFNDDLPISPDCHSERSKAE